MKIKIAKEIKEVLSDKWVSFNDEVSFKIHIPDRFKILLIDSNFSNFGKLIITSVIEWTGIIGDDDELLECTQDNIEVLLMSHPEIYEFLQTELNKLFEQLDAQIKN